MFEYGVPRPTNTTYALAIGAAMLAGQSELYGKLQYPTREQPYLLQSERGTYSEFKSRIARFEAEYQFAQRLAAIYDRFTEGQVRLGVEFETAIFSDLESLYED